MEGLLSGAVPVFVLFYHFTPRDEKRVLFRKKFINETIMFQA
jgi:hypothetical protein